MPAHSARAVAVYALAAVLSACSFIAPKSAPPPASTPTLSQRELDLEAAEAMVLVVADMPPGWAASEHQRTPSDESDARNIAACAGMVSPSRYTADIDGEDFKKGNLEIETSTSIVPTLKEARSDLRAIRRSKFDSCVLSVGKTDIGSDLVSASITPIPVKRFGDAALAFRLAARFKHGAKTLTIYNDLVLLLIGRAEVGATFLNVGHPFPASLEHSLTKKLGAKLKRV